ncbi:hypothetical protein K502DRAFT_353883 [Neoconidiobolus thromboides FSU 785]|nr:hypothetical protein K502DRAFT_353883 [Neoconidiobolus thromboides FSU 785]
MQTFINKLQNGIFENFNTIGRSIQSKHYNSLISILRATYNNPKFMEFCNKTKQRKDILSKFTIDNNKLDQPMYKISALRETGNKNQQVALLSTTASVYRFDEYKSFGFNINRNQHGYSKISNNNKISTLQPIIKIPKKLKMSKLKLLYKIY